MSEPRTRQLLKRAAAPGAGYPIDALEGDHVFTATVVGDAAVSATVVVEGSNDLIGYSTIATLTLSGTATASGSASTSKSYRYWRANVTAISGGAVSVTSATEEGGSGMGGLADGEEYLKIRSTSSGLVVKTVVRCTQAEYTATSPKDPETLYVIEEGYLYRGDVQIGGGGGGASGVTFTVNSLSALLYLTANGNPLLPGKAISTSYTSNTAIQTDGTTAAATGWSTGELQSVQGGLTYYVDKIRFLAWYTSTKVFISLVDIADGAAAQTVVAPANAVYAKFTVKATNTATAYFNPGSAANKINNVVLGQEARLPALRSHLIAWTKSEAYQITSTITYNAGGKVDTTGTVNILWPNGATGQIKIFYNADWTVQYYYLTYENDGQRHYITQPTITYNGSQQPTLVPALTVSAG